MTALVFLFSVAVIFGAVLALEVRDTGELDLRRPVGLFAWLTGGNWPAKIGGGLLVVGVGALLRYALINLDVSPTAKLATGVIAAGLLGLGATLTRIGPGRRAVSLALAGAAFGVAYLTAYSAFALFHYLDDLRGVALLALTALGAGVYAITRGALSLALLSMVGAYLAPAFAVGDPGPAVVYGYYVGASLLVLVMTAVRGWRPLIHLSLLFTLVGGSVFAWTARYFVPAYAEVMLPAVLVLAVVHLLMPVFERRTTHGTLIERLDLAYALVLPLAAALAALLVSPSRHVLSVELLWLGAAWFAVAGLLLSQRRAGVALHALIGLLLAGCGVAVRFHDLPWELLALAVSVAALWLAVRRPDSERLVGALAGIVALVGFVHLISSLSDQDAGSRAFLNARFIERLVGAGLLMMAGQVCRRARQSLDTLLWSVGVGWALIALTLELVRLDLVSVSLLLHWSVLAIVLVLAWVRTTPEATSTPLVLLPILVVLTASWAAGNAPASVSWASLLLAPVALVALAVRRAGVERPTQSGRALSALLAPLAAGVWALHVDTLQHYAGSQFALAVVLLVLLLVLVVARALLERCSDWLGTAAEIATFVFALVLLVVTTLDISRSPWGMLAEALALAGMLWLVYNDRPTPVLPRWLAPGSALGAALVLQAYLLRWLGPPGHLDLGAIARMRWPTLASLLWAGMGALLTYAGRRQRSRALWMAGAALLVVAALKIVLLDFGSLGQLTNILAVIAAGVVFMLVGWLAPMPPAAEADADADADSEPPPQAPMAVQPGGGAPAPEATPAAAESSAAAPLALRAAAASPGAPAPAVAAPAAAAASNDLWERNARTRAGASLPHPQTPESSSRKTIWTIVIVVLLLVPLVQCTSTAVRWLRLGTRLMQVDARPIDGTQHAGDAGIDRGLGSDHAASIDVVEPVEVSQLPPPLVVRADDVVVHTACSDWAASLPPDYVVHAAGAYKGKPTRFQLDADGGLAGWFNVSVREPGRKVVLLLGAYEPTIFVVRWTPATRIVGVWLSGHGRAEVEGLPLDVPVLRTRLGDRSGCPGFYVTTEDSRAVGQASLQVLGRVPDGAWTGSDGSIVIGPGAVGADYVQGPTRNLESYRDPTLPLAGADGIAELMQQHRLRAATPRDVEEWQRLSGRVTSREGLPVIPSRTYVVLAPMSYPAGLYGGHSVAFIIPRGTVVPTGNPGHSAVLDLNAL
jgi:uncharacterized membrane protein